MSFEKKLPLLIGESPSAAGDRYHDFPLSGNPAKWVCAVADLDLDIGDRAPRIGDYYWTMIRHFDTANALRRYPRGGWNAQAAAGRVMYLVAGYSVVVLVGRRAQRAYAHGVDKYMEKMPFYVWKQDGSRWVVTIPHTSGLNRIYNEPGELEKARSVLKKAMELARV